MNPEVKLTIESINHRHTVRWFSTTTISVVAIACASISVVNTRDTQVKDQAYRTCLETVERISKESPKSDRLYSLPSCSWGR